MWAPIAAGPSPANPNVPAWSKVRAVADKWGELASELDDLLAAGDEPADEPAAPVRRVRVPRGAVLGVLGVLAAGAVAVGWWTVGANAWAAHQQARVVSSLPWANPPADAGRCTLPSRGPAPAAATPAPGEVFAILRAPAWGADYARPIAEGLGRGSSLGHYPGTALPGAFGTFAIAGSRSTGGEPLSRITEQNPGDAIVVQTAAAWLVYRVTDAGPAAPSDASALATPSSVRAIVLTSSVPGDPGRRWVVHGVLDFWCPADQGPPAGLPGPR